MRLALVLIGIEHAALARLFWGRHHTDAMLIPALSLICVSLLAPHWSFVRERARIDAHLPPVAAQDGFLMRTLNEYVVISEYVLDLLERQRQEARRVRSSADVGKAQECDSLGPGTLREAVLQ